MKKENQMFNELKEKCLLVRKKYENRPGNYYQEKVDYVNRITHPDDAFILINMFDTFNQKELRDNLSDECKRFYGDYFLIKRLFFFNKGE